MATVLPQTRTTRLDDIAWVIESEFKEMPGMRLTSPQVRRLWHLSTEDCDRVLDYLVGAGRLVQDEDDRFFLPYETA
jgi:hypothetical protein